MGALPAGRSLTVATSASDAGAPGADAGASGAGDPDAGRIASVDLYLVGLTLRSPFVSAHGTETERRVVLVRVERADGVTGWGECSTLGRPTYTAEYTDGAWTILADELAPALLQGRASGVAGHPMARAALSAAVLDASARAAGQSLAQVLCGLAGEPSPRASVATTRVLGLPADEDAAVEAVAQALAAGHRSVKLKVTAESAGHLAAIRRVWPHRSELELAADANGSLGRAPAAFFERLDGLELAYLEQPFPADDLVLTGRLAEHLLTPIALDESLTSVAAAQAAFELGALQVANVKPGRVGGLPQAVALVSLARQLEVPAFVGGMLETGIGRAAALALAGLPGCDLPTDLGPSAQYFAHDLTTPFTLQADGTLAIPAGPGLGVEPDPERLAAATRRHVALAR